MPIRAAPELSQLVTWRSPLLGVRIGEAAHPGPDWVDKLFAAGAEVLAAKNPVEGARCWVEAELVEALDGGKYRVRMGQVTCVRSESHVRASCAGSYEVLQRRHGRFERREGTMFELVRRKKQAGGGCSWELVIWQNGQVMKSKARPVELLQTGRCNGTMQVLPEQARVSDTLTGGDYEWKHVEGGRIAFYGGANPPAGAAGNPTPAFVLRKVADEAAAAAPEDLREHQESVTRRIVQHLKNEVWCRVGASRVHGAGLFALRDIPAGTNVDHVPYQLDPRCPQRVTDLVFPKSALASVPPEVAEFVKEMWVTEVSAPGWDEPVLRMTGFGANAYMGLGHFVNHPPAGTPSNVRVVRKVPTRAAPTTADIGLHWKMITTRPVAAGEELFVDYERFLGEEERTQMPGILDAVTAAKDVQRGQALRQLETLRTTMQSAEPDLPQAVRECRKLLERLEELEKQQQSAGEGTRKRKR